MPIFRQANSKEAESMRKIAVVYWSGTGNAEKMAEEVCDGSVGREFKVDLLPVG